MANTTNFGIELPVPGGYRNQWGGTLNSGISKVDELLALALPVGTIQMYVLSSPPAATANGGTWLVCNGQTVLVSDYPVLDALIGTTYGARPLSSQFVLPDLRARVPIGYNPSAIGSAGDSQRKVHAIANSGGEENHTLSVAELHLHSHSLPNVAHTHTFTTDGNTSLDAETNLAKSNFEINDHSHTTYRFTDYLANVIGGTGNEGVAHGGAGKSETMIRYLDNWRTDAVSTSSTKLGTELVGNDGANNDGHKHSIPDNGHTHPGTTNGTVPFTSTDAVTGNAGTANGAQHENMPPFLTVNYIILAKHPTFT